MKKRLLAILVIAGLVLTLLPIPVLGASAPTLSSVSVWNITASTATINYTLTDGGEACQVYIGYGPTAVGIVPSSYIYGEMRNSPEPGKMNQWGFLIDVGFKTSGSYQRQLTGLWYAEYIPVCVYAYNSGGADADTPSPYFSTMQPLEGPELYYETGYDSHDSAVTSTVWKAQTFNTTDAINVTMVSLMSWSMPSAVYNITLSIRATDGSGYPTGGDLGAGVLYSPYPGGGNGWVEFWLDEPVSLTGSTQYALILSCATWASYYVYHWYDADNGYASGRMYRSNDAGSTWTAEEGTYATRDAMFRIYDRGIYTGIEYCGGKTHSLTIIGETSAILQGYLTYIGGVDDVTQEQQDATVYFDYGLTTSYGSTTVAENISPSLPYVYAKTISGLTAGTTYHYRFNAENNMGVVYFADATFTTRDASEEGDLVVSGVSMSFPHQRNSFYAEGRYWLFYVDGSQDVNFVSSEDGSTWGNATLVAGGVDEYSFALTFDREYVHAIWATRGYPLYYRMGKPNAGGTITWQAVAQEALAAHGGGDPDDLWTTSSITTDTNGYPWIIAGLCTDDADSMKIVVTASTTKNGTWTVKASFPTAPGSIFGAYYQRGSLVGLANGNMYAIAGKRANDDAWSVNKWCGSGGEYLKGSVWNGTAWGSVDTITTTRMAWIGDGAMTPYLLWSVVPYQNDVYLVFTNQGMTTAPNSTHNIQFVRRVDGVGWDSEVTVQAGVLERTSPVLSIDDSGFLYCFWGNSPDLHKVYYKKRVAGTWDTNPTAWKFENLLEGSGEGEAGLFSIQSGEYATEGLVALHYNVGGNINIAYMSTGFAVSTRVTDDIGAFTATANGYLIDDGGETCSVRFQYGATISYGFNTNWQTGFTTDEEFDATIYSLTSNTTYHVRAQAKHADGFTVSGADRTFTTGLYDDTITGFKGIPYSTSIGLSWDTGAPEYLVRFAFDDYPSSTIDGSSAYSGNSTSTTHTGLSAGTTYYYSLWGKSGESYSGNYATLMLTTSAYIAPGDTLPAPEEPTSWMAAPDYERMAGLGYFYDGVNGTADALEIPRATLWFLGCFGLCGVLTLLFYLKIRQSRGAGTLTFGILAFLLFGGLVIGLMPFWIPLLSVIPVILLALSHKEVTQS